MTIMETGLPGRAELTAQGMLELCRTSQVDGYGLDDLVPDDPAMPYFELHPDFGRHPDPDDRRVDGRNARKRYRFTVMVTGRTRGGATRAYDAVYEAVYGKRPTVDGYTCSRVDEESSRGPTRDDPDLYDSYSGDVVFYLYNTPTT